MTRAAINALPAAAPAPDLSDPVTVHANMLRGTIAKPTVEQIIHLYGADVLRATLTPNPVDDSPGPDPVVKPAPTLSEALAVPEVQGLVRTLQAIADVEGINWSGVQAGAALFRIRGSDSRQIGGEG